MQGSGPGANVKPPGFPPGDKKLALCIVMRYIWIAWGRNHTCEELTKGRGESGSRKGGSALAFKVHGGPPEVSIHQGQTVLVCEESGEIIWPSGKGLYFLDTRVVSCWRIYANGISWQLLNGGAISYSTARTFLTNRSIPTENGTIPPRTLGLSIGRSITGGLPTKAVLNQWLTFGEKI